MALPLLPDNVLQRLVCQECFQYLSVPPITSNASGKTICGRCFNCIAESARVQSSYNIIAEGFSFKCINHYNGCSKLLSPTETEEHEKTCAILKQECYSCSFSGVVSQILYHSLKIHPENVTYDGRIDFFLNDMSFQRKIIFVLNDNIILITVSTTDVLFSIEVSTISQPVPPFKTHFGLKFFKPDDSSKNLQVEYGLLEVNLENCFEKSKDELISVFGPGEKICCQIFMGHFALEREQEFKQKFLKLSQRDTELNNLKNELENKEQDFLQQTNVWETKLSEQEQLYNYVLNIIKKMPWNFRCFSCRNVTLTEVYFCPKNHFYCTICLRNICKACDSPQEYKQLKEIGTLLVPCDWPGCIEMFCLKDYMEHKALCLKRHYKCPIRGCNIEIISVQNLLDHNRPGLFLNQSHSGLLFSQDSSISCKINNAIDCYWVVKGDLYHVLMNIDNKIRVSINEVDVIGSVSFKCRGLNPYGENISFSDFREKYDITIGNVNNYYSCINISFD